MIAKLTEKSRMLIIASGSLVAGGILMAVIDRFAMKTDLEFLSMIHQEVSDAARKLKTDLDDKEDDSQ